MERRTLGRTGLKISNLTFGTTALDRLGSTDTAEAVAAARLAFEGGINAIELESGSPVEAFLGDILQHRSASDPIHIFSRARSLVSFALPSPHIPVFEAYPGAALRAQTEASLKRLDVERLACQFIDAWCPEWLEEGDWLETLVRLRDEGKIAAIGISLFDHDVDAGMGAVASGLIDCVEVMFNIFDQGAAGALFRLCQQHGVGVIARAPLYFGGLSRRVHRPQPFAEGDWRHDYFFDDHLAEVRGRARQLEHALEGSGESVEEVALRFCLSHPAVSTVAVGMSTKEQVQANLRAAELGPLDGGRLHSLRAHRWLC